MLSDYDDYLTPYEVAYELALSLIIIFKLKVYKKPSKSSHIWLLRRFFVYTLIKN